MLRIRPFASDDRALGLRLSRQAGWNQNAADWRRLFDLQPDGGIVAEWDGVPVGTTMTTVFGPVAWIAMVLVDESARGRGIGTALVQRSVDDLDRRGLETIRLDATPLGQPLYERLGFVAQFRLARFEGTLPAAAADGRLSLRERTSFRGAKGDTGWERLAELDRSATGTDRRRLLLSLFREQPESVRCARTDGQVVGYFASRPGSLATHLGPCCATAEAGERLLRDAWRRYEGRRVFLDVPTANAAAVRLAESMGLNVQRTFTRMCRGLPVNDNQEYLWASAGPEKG